MGEAKRKRMAGISPKAEGEATITVWAFLPSKTGGMICSKFYAARVGDILEKADGKVTQAEAKDYLLRAIGDKKRMIEEGHVILATLLWLACRSEIGRVAEERAREGGVSIGFLITRSDGSEAWNFEPRIFDGHLDPKEFAKKFGMTAERHSLDAARLSRM
jgi:hypothetical protein